LTAAFPDLKSFKFDDDFWMMFKKNQFKKHKTIKNIFEYPVTVKKA